MQGCVYNLCVCVIPGFHWVTAFFWLMSQQTDICAGPWRWRVFNGTLAIVHVFCFLNVKDGPSRFRMAGFYLVGFKCTHIDIHKPTHTHTLTLSLSLSLSLSLPLFLLSSAHLHLAHWPVTNLTLPFLCRQQADSSKDQAAGMPN